MMKTHKKPLRTAHAKSSEYKLSIALPKTLIEAIDRKAEAQWRTRNSVIREVLADTFLKVA